MRRTSQPQTGVNYSDRVVPTPDPCSWLMFTDGQPHIHIVAYEPASVRVMICCYSICDTHAWVGSYYCYCYCVTARIVCHVQLGDEFVDESWYMPDVLDPYFPICIFGIYVYAMHPMTQ
ncbi:hypothetical protein QAD02_016789 [Eretmocerus hayati]|uniref:Uncharacterized protein n=1 Tax=Eretmocerus hayati TaxID=131215 RepID=A0ACC2PC41_9HYME|nr:hypothetical protein QAD02_016789 [Eretmocerus hayati]